MYDPKKVAVFKRQLGMLAKQQMLDRGLDGGEVLRRGATFDGGG